jgi:hypothetical protein
MLCLAKQGRNRALYSTNTDKENRVVTQADAELMRDKLARKQLESADNLRHTLAQADRAAEEVRRIPTPLHRTF